ncbi:MAG TPA: hypothetical protein VKV80_10515 [Streptosporangiaceae bacterium]|nr:hypothetical protein [Streptosporangiaceae bacterium]
MRTHPGAVLGAVEAALRARGLTRLYGAACARYGVLSIIYGLSAWCDGRTLWWDHDGRRATWPATDPVGAADRLADLARSASQPDPPPHSPRPDTTPGQEPVPPPPGR